MSYFIPQPRRIRVLSGSLSDVTWPTQAILQVTLVPEEIFGTSSCTSPRMVLVSKSPTRAFWNANIGKAWQESDVFLPEFLFEKELKSGLVLKFKGNSLAAEFNATSLDHLSETISLMEHYIPAYLSLQITVFVRVEQITGSLSSLKFSVEVSSGSSPIKTLNEQQRASYVNEALDLCQVMDSLSDRFILACMYYRQALRFESAHESSIPSLNTAELILNLAKCVEMLCGSRRDRVREICSVLGYTSDQIESQIIPILIIRSEFDVAHPVGTRIENQHIETVHKYARRSLCNVQTLLVKIGRALCNGHQVLTPLEGSSEDNRVKLCNRLEEYLKRPLLPLE